MSPSDLMRELIDSFPPVTSALCSDEEEKHHFNKPNGNRVYFHGQVEHDDFEKKKLAEFH